MKTIGSAILCGALLLTAASCGKMKMPEVSMPKMLQAEPADVKVRNQITQVLKAGDEIAYHREIADLLELSNKVGWDNHRLLMEAVAYYPTIDNNDHLPGYFRLLETLRVPRTTIVDVVAAHVQNQPAAAKSVNDALLRWAAPPEARGRADFSHFRPYLETHQAQPAQGVVVWMYQHDAAAALAEMMALYGKNISAEQRRDITLAQHLVSEVLWRDENGLLESEQYYAAARQQLDSLSQSPYWWVRLYASQMISANTKLRTDEVLHRLSEDENPMVRGTLPK